MSLPFSYPIQFAPFLSPPYHLFVFFIPPLLFSGKLGLIACAHIFFFPTPEEASLQHQIPRFFILVPPPLFLPFPHPLFFIFIEVQLFALFTSLSLLGLAKSQSIDFFFSLLFPPLDLLLPPLPPSTSFRFL